MQNKIMMLLLLFIILIATATCNSKSPQVSNSSSNSSSKPVEPPAPTMWLGGVNMKLGTSKSEIIGKLEVNCNIRPGNEDGQPWMILGKQTNEWIGSVSFQEGKLSLANKHLGVFVEPESFKFGKALFSALTALNEEGKKAATIRARKIDENEIIEIDFGGRIVDITISDFKDKHNHYQQVQLDDRLSSGPSVIQSNEMMKKMVFINRGGTDFHLTGCRNLSINAINISVENAAKEHYKPCSVCKPLAEFGITEDQHQ